MLAFSPDFESAIRQGANVIPLLTVMKGPQVLLPGQQLLPGATVTFDEAQASRRTFSGQIADTGGLAPHLPSDPLAPYAIEGVVSCGLTLPSGVIESKQLGIFRLNVVQGTSTGNISITGPDRSAVIAAAQNESPYTIAALTPLDVAIGEYLVLKYPSMPFLFDAAAHGCLLGPTPTVYQEGSNSGDPMQNMMDLASQFGREFFVDEQGRATLQLVADPTLQIPVYTYVPGIANLALTGTHTIDTSQNVYNVFVAEGDGSVTDPSTGLAPRASYEITDHTSPIYPDPNGFGRRPLFISSPDLTTDALCLQAAIGASNRKFGADNQIQFSAVPNPCHVPGDVVRYESDELGVAYSLLLSAWQLDCGLLAPVNYATRLAN